MNLTDEQLAVAAHRSGPAMVLAVAGSGKTTAIMHWVAALVKSGVQTKSILVTTFSRDGAAEMAARWRKMQIMGPTLDAKTIHSVAWGIVFAGKPTWKLAPEWWFDKVIENGLEQFGSSLGDDNIGSSASDVKMVSDLISRAKSDLVFCEPWEDAFGQKHKGFNEWYCDQADYDELNAHVLWNVYNHYEESRKYLSGNLPDQLKAGDVACSHDDILAELARDILTKSPWTSASLGKWEYVAVDEAQDNSLAQWILVDHITKVQDNKLRNVMVVADDQQAIYSWRGGRIDLLRSFAKSEGVVLYPLSRNFRSAPEIIDAANSILSVVPERICKDRLICGRSDLIGTISVKSFKSMAEEGEFVANDISNELRKGVNPGEIVVLSRLNTGTAMLEIELGRRGIAYSVLGPGFFSRPEVEAIIKYITLVSSPSDCGALRGIYNVPTRYIRRDFLTSYPSLRALREGENYSFSKGARRLLRELDALDIRLKKSGLVSAIEFIADSIGVREHAKKRAKDGDELVDYTIEALISFANDAGSVASFLAIAKGDSGYKNTSNDKIRLSSIHKFKGQESKIVYVMGANEGQLPYSDDMEEERRLAYVAFTRAKEKLTFTHAPMRQGETSRPSRFLSEAGVELIKKDIESIYEL